MEATLGVYWIFGVMTGLAIAGARERRRWRESMADASAAAYAEGLVDGRRSVRTVTLWPEVERSDLR